MITPGNLVSDKPPFRSLLRITLNVVLGFVIVGPLLGFAVSSGYYSGDLFKDLQDYSAKPGFRESLFIMQGIVTFVGLICFPLIHIKLLEQKSLHPFFPPRQDMMRLLLIVGCVGIAFPVAISPLSEWNMNLKFPEFMSGFETWATEEEEKLAKLTQAITDFQSLPDMLIGLLVIAILPAIGEELVFRGMIQQELWRATMNAHLAIWLSAAIFSAIHVQFYGFIPRLLLGALFGYLYYWTGNLLVPIFSHFVNNAFAVIMVYLSQIGAITVDMESGESAPVMYVAAATLITIGLLYYIWKNYKDSHMIDENNSFPDNGPFA